MSLKLLLYCTKMDKIDQQRAIDKWTLMINIHEYLKKNNNNDEVNILDIRSYLNTGSSNYEPIFTIDFILPYHFTKTAYACTINDDLNLETRNMHTTSEKQIFLLDPPEKYKIIDEYFRKNWCKEVSKNMKQIDDKKAEQKQLDNVVNEPIITVTNFLWYGFWFGFGCGLQLVTFIYTRIYNFLCILTLFWSILSSF